MLSRSSHLISTHSRHRPAAVCLQRLSTRVSAAATDITSPLPDADSYPHISVLLNPILDFFKPIQLRTYVDGTLGAGGHACAMMNSHPELETLVGIDVDPTAHDIASKRIAGLGRPNTQVKLFRGNHRNMKRFLSSLPAPAHAAPGTSTSLYGHVDGILLDLGVSSMQIDTAERGFSFLRDGRIDMRMDPDAKFSAEEIVNTWSEAELGRIIRDYGEDKLWRQIARRIVTARASQALTTTSQLVAAIGDTVMGGRGKGRKGSGSGPKTIHPATRTFQALRIATNDEINLLEQALPDAIMALGKGGRLQVISFHSLEDRAVKRAFAKACGKPTPEDEHLLAGPDKFAYLDQLEASAICKQVTRKPVEADEQECKANPRSRSAKLRVVERI